MASRARIEMPPPRRRWLLQTLSDAFGAIALARLGRTGDARFQAALRRMNL